MRIPCTHLDLIQDVRPSAEGCEDCLRIGDTWVHLRECLSRGHVGCCDSSKNKHATAHFHHGEHPLVKSFEPGEDWMRCYVGEVVMEVRDAGDDRAGQPRARRDPGVLPPGDDGPLARG